MNYLFGFYVKEKNQPNRFFHDLLRANQKV